MTTPLPIKTDFQKHGYRFTQTFRDGELAVYRQHVNGGLTDRWEVVRIKVAPASEIRGKTIESRERYPADEEWGRNAFTCWTESEAMSKLTVWKADLAQRKAGNDQQRPDRS